MGWPQRRHFVKSLSYEAKPQTPDELAYWEWRENKERENYPVNDQASSRKRYTIHEDEQEADEYQWQLEVWSDSHIKDFMENKRGAWEKTELAELGASDVLNSELEETVARFRKYLGEEVYYPDFATHVVESGMETVEAWLQLEWVNFVSSVWLEKFDVRFIEFEPQSADEYAIGNEDEFVDDD